MPQGKNQKKKPRVKRKAKPPVRSEVQDLGPSKKKAALLPDSGRHNFSKTAKKNFLEKEETAEFVVELGLTPKELEQKIKIAFLHRCHSYPYKAIKLDVCHYVNGEMSETVFKPIWNAVCGDLESAGPTSQKHLRKLKLAAAAMQLVYPTKQAVDAARNTAAKSASSAISWLNGQANNLDVGDGITNSSISDRLDFDYESASEDVPGTSRKKFRFRKKDKDIAQANLLKKKPVRMLTEEDSDGDDALVTSKRNPKKKFRKAREGTPETQKLIDKTPREKRERKARALFE